MNKHATISELNHALVVTGELNFKTVVDLWRDSMPLLSKGSDLHFDLSAVTNSNSAGLALLLEWMKYAKTHHRSIQFSHIPTQLQSIIDVSGVEKILG